MTMKEPDDTGTLYSIRHTSEGVKYNFTDDATEWKKEAVREFGVVSKEEVADALRWRESIDEMSDEQAARVMRGKHPNDDSKEISCPKNPND